MISYHTLRISDIEKLTKDSVAIQFEVPENLASAYQFGHGQFVRLQVKIGSEMIERSYSICSAPYERKLRIAIKRVEGGVFSNFANDSLTEGDEIEVSVPQGAFTHRLDSSAKKHYLLVAAGSGITPIISILKMVLASETLSHCTLVYANKTPDSAMFKTQLEDLVEKYKDRMSFISVYSQSEEGDYQGRMDLALIKQIMSLDAFDEFFVCGPKQMSVELYDGMIENGLSSENTHIELFESSDSVSEVSDQTANSKIKITIDGDSFEYDFDDATRTILDTALDYESDLPYGCQNGSCGACQAKVVSGSVDMEVNYALSQSELDEGLVLVCQARPTSSKVEIDYDA